MNKYNTDGFNERSNYIHNELDKNKKFNNFDSSFAKMRINENKPDIKISNTEKNDSFNSFNPDVIKNRLNMFKK